MHELSIDMTATTAANRGLLALMANPECRDAGAFTQLYTYLQRRKDKLVNFSLIGAEAHKSATKPKEQDAAGRVGLQTDQ